MIHNICNILNAPISLICRMGLSHAGGVAAAGSCFNVGQIESVRLFQIGWIFSSRVRLSKAPSVSLESDCP